ncbi:MATE family efflux transporter [Pantoea trifolii]|uniref:Polysaccharide biosynthesis protein n=1 Tax=Pantoea trifolii TaxID=2968030 RepID=A0ABT1VNZ5_9GAMM|nr:MULTISPECIES: hypothetical protein [unclassified Pantoea]MCQ8228304.1 hypothetical protein [Pantoea sp. MMK2]MCQ8236477.1 hypothetical protein [Pantoea sp. MMK3]
MNKRIFNVTLRGLTLISRFLFIFFLAKYLEPSILGAYGIFTATVGYALYFVGLDFYVFTTREILKNDKKRWGGFLKNQACVSSVLYVFLLIALVFLIALQKITIIQTLWFFVILFFEHLNQEISRLLIAIHKQTVASVLLFLRQGLWAIIVVVLMMFYPVLRTLEFVFALWLASGVLTFVLGLLCLHKVGMGGWRDKIDYHWIKLGIQTSGIFLIATLALRGIQTVDRYWIQSLNGLDVVGAYVLFIGMASTLMTFLDAGVFSFSYPTLIKLHNDNKKTEFSKQLSKMTLSTILLTIVFVAVSLLVMPYLLKWTGKTVYFEYLDIYYVLMSATIFNALGMISHYALYAKGEDKIIIISHVTSMIVFALATVTISKWSAILCVPLGLNVAFLYIFIFKTLALVIERKSS